MRPQLQCNVLRCAELVVERKQGPVWHMVDHLNHGDSSLLDAAAPLRVRITAPPLPAAATTFTVSNGGAAVEGSGGNTTQDGSQAAGSGCGVLARRCVRLRST